MEIILSAAIGILSASGIWLLLRPRSFQVVIGLCLLSYAVNLFIFSMGRLTPGAPPIMPKGGFVDPTLYAVISFATTALFLVVMIVSRGLTGTDHVDGKERSQ